VIIALLIWAVLTVLLLNPGLFEMQTYRLLTAGYVLWAIVTIGIVLIEMVVRKS